MKILLICPQHSNAFFTSMAPDSFYHSAKSVNRRRRPSAATVVPIGLSYIAASLESLHDVRLVYQDFGLSDIVDFDPDIVGISCVLSLQESVTFEVAEFVEQVSPSSKVIVGGTHPTALPERMLACKSIDYVILGEGEWSMLELACRLENGERIDDIDGLAFMKDGSVRINPKTHLIPDLDDLPVPNLIFNGTVPRSLSASHTVWNRRVLLSFAVDKYEGNHESAERASVLDRRRLSMDIGNQFRALRSELSWVERRIQCLVTSRGCPYDCEYCTSQMMWQKRHRKRSVENLVEEVSRFPHREVIICDENMTLDRQRAMDFFRAAKPLKKLFFFYNGVDLYTLDDELIKVMKQGGVAKISISIETGSKNMSQRIKRRLNFEKINEVLIALKRNKILTVIYFIVGFPGETENDVLQTIDTMLYCMKKYPVIVHVYKFLNLPGSKLYETHCGQITPNFDEYCFFPVEEYEVLQIGDSVALMPPEMSALIERSDHALAVRK